MARSLLSMTLRAVKAAERERVRSQNSAIRQHNAAIKERARAAKSAEAYMRKAAISNERELKAAHVESQLAEVESLNAEISQVFEELDGLLQATMDFDDYIDLELLKKSEVTTPFDRPDLEDPTEAPKMPILPAQPVYVEPAQPKGFFGKKKKLEEARASQTAAHQLSMTKWNKKVADLKSKFESETSAYEEAEKNRKKLLAKEKARFSADLQEHNGSIDSFITNLSYGDAAAIQEYISLVVENSTYPDHFQVDHDFTFEPTTAELRMEVSIPRPSEFPTVKAYKYIKASDEIRETPLSKTEQKERYGSAIYQVSIRTLHEVFEADRRGLIRTISLSVGTYDNDPATGKRGFIPFVGVGAERESFMEFDLSSVVPMSTLKHLGATISTDPINLVKANVAGVRKS